MSYGLPLSRSLAAGSAVLSIRSSGCFVEWYSALEALEGLRENRLVLKMFSHGYSATIHRQHNSMTCIFASGCRDLNPGPLDPQSSALTKLRHSPLLNYQPFALVRALS